MSLRNLLIDSAQKMPDAIAVNTYGQATTYGELDELTNLYAHALARLGVERGDRVGIWLGKSAMSVAAMQAVLRLRAIYVPLDPLSPAERIRTIVRDCDMHALVTTKQCAETLLMADLQQITCLYVDGEKPGIHWENLLQGQDQPLPNMFEPELALADEIAYLLYTSGSTGKPKGVCISNRNALAFIEWAAQILEATSADRIANHAPFHFDLSVLDLYVAFSVGATVYLIPDEISSIPQRLVSLLVQEALTVWYSVPSVLVLMTEYAGLLDLPTLPLRALLFAGEPFPIKYLSRLYQRYGSMLRFFNLYGPTETNVCTYYEVTDIPENWNKPVPIGKACSGDDVWAESAAGTLVQPGEEGELIVAGPTVMVGYWGQQPHGDKPYRTGDLVQLLDDGNYTYVGRCDQQVKVRGYRIEPGDIETVLEGHSAIGEAAVLVIGRDLDARLVAFVVYAKNKTFSLLEVKKLCSENLPRYMIVDDIYPISALPRTRNGKIDRLVLHRIYEENRSTG
jgi:amino acid adenylation domain-containing protein